MDQRPWQSLSLTPKGKRLIERMREIALEQEIGEQEAFDLAWVELGLDDDEPRS